MLSHGPRRLLTSTVDLAGDPEAFFNNEDPLKGELIAYDIPAATAVTNSARFPLISPAGRFQTKTGSRQVVDGGYFDNYGVRTTSDLVYAVEHAAKTLNLNVRPIVAVFPTTPTGS
ncbi:MAG: hypothetical protein RQ966_20020 [Acetobacteraceae bacterium]|nr:hypothetical protein [Acetobacteraceae bacterium]